VSALILGDRDRRERDVLAVGDYDGAAALLNGLFTGRLTGHCFPKSSTWP
jgi:hypothetical protein